MWVGDAGKDTVYRVGPQTEKTVATIALPKGAYGGGLIAGAGYLWDLNDVGIWRINPRVNRVTGFFTVPTRPDCALSLPEPGFCVANYTIGGGWLWALVLAKRPELIRVAPDD